MPRRTRPRPTRPPVPALATLAATLAALALAGPAAAQDADPTLTGRVVDAVSGAPVAGARVVWDDSRRATLTDAEGRFRLRGMAGGEGLLHLAQYGYQEAAYPLRVQAGVLALGDLALPPDPLMVEGVTVMADRLGEVDRRLRSRRRAVAVASRAFEQERLMRSGAQDVADFLRLEAGVLPTPCPRSLAGESCIVRRGRAVVPRVFIDDAPAIGGMDQLASYRPWELHLVEVLSAGSQIRAYTHGFMERMVRRRQALMPILLP